MARDKPRHQIPGPADPVEIAADVLGTDAPSYLPGANKQPLTQTADGRLRVSAEERLQETLELVVYELRQLRLLVAMIHGVNVNDIND
jgi:hypothetical protein